MRQLSRQNFLSIIHDQKHGFSFGEPERVDKDSLSVVLPIVRNTSAKRSYMTLPETDELIIHDTGIIDRMNIRNASKENIFIRSGTLFQGKTQERTTIRSSVIFPGKENTIEVRCVHATKGIVGGQKTQYGGITPLHVEQMVHAKGFSKPAEQSLYWNSISSFSLCASTRALDHDLNLVDYQHQGGVAPPDSRFPMTEPGIALDDLSSNIDVFSKNFDEILSKVKLQNNQVGLGLITDEGCKTVEVFDVPISWEALHKDAVKRMGTDLAKQDKENVFDYKAEKAIGAVRQVLAQEYEMSRIFEHRKSNEGPQVEITSLSSKGYVGEVVEIAGAVIHLVLLKRG